MTGALRGLVLAGGRSTRMGRDKAVLAYHGRDQLQVAFELLGEADELAVLDAIGIRRKLWGLPRLGETDVVLGWDGWG